MKKKLDRENMLERDGFLTIMMIHLQILILVFSVSSAEKSAEQAPQQMSSVENYRIKARVREKSRYLKSPFEDHVAKARLKAELKNLLSFAWDGEKNHNEILYLCNDTKKFIPLSREQFWTLQDEECVSTAVVDNLVSILTLEMLRASTDGLKRLIVPCTANLLDTMMAGQLKLNDRTVAGARDAFLGKLELFDYMNETTYVNIKKLEYIFMPTVYKDHFIIFALNLKKNRYEYLTSLRTETYERAGVIEALGKRFMNEAMAYVEHKYEVINEDSNINWDEFDWYDADIIVQPDSFCCGVIAMQLLQHWDGEEKAIEAFKGWNRFGDERKKKTVIEWRMALAVSLLTSGSNALAYNIKLQANEFIAEREKTMAEEKKKHAAKLRSAAPPHPR